MQTRRSSVSTPSWMAFVFFCVAMHAATVHAASGNLKVTSFPSGAEVIVDGTSTGRVTPMSIALGEREHIVTVQIPGPPRPGAIVQAHGLPMAFIPNQGQVDPQVAYYAPAGGGTFYFTKAGIVLDFLRRERHGARSGGSVGSQDALGATRLTLRQGFVGANPSPRIEAAGRQPGRTNILRGRDASKWLQGLANYSTLTYRDLYPGVDLTLTGEPDGLKYAFVVGPGADYTRIRVAYAGVDGLSLDYEGDLIIRTAFGPLSDARPVSYQEVDGRRVEVPSRYRIRGSAYAFEVGTYDPRHPLIIDPKLVFSTFLGGGSSEAGRAIAVDASGVYVAGETESADFPNLTGITSYAGSSDAFVAKLDSTGSTLLYSTLLGGSGSDMARGIAVDGGGNAYLTGETRSPEFPTTTGAFDTTLDGSTDAFMAKLDPAGAVLLYSTLIGGIDVDGGAGIAVDSLGHAYLTGHTGSPDFPATAGAFDTGCGTDGGCNPRLDTGFRFSDAFLLKLDPAAAGADSLLYGTFLGGRGTDHGFAVAVDGSGNAYVTGSAADDTFPTTAGAFDRTFNGTGDAFVAKLDASGASLAYSTFLGGDRSDRGNGIAVDALGNAHVTGSTESANFPTTPDAFDRTCGTDGSCNPGPTGLGADVFVTKLHFTGASLLYSTLVGGSQEDVGRSIALDASGSALVAGSTMSSDFPTTPFSFDQTFIGGGLHATAFLVKLHPTGMGLRYGTFLGLLETSASGIAVDASGDAYLTGSTEPSLFPTTFGAFDTTGNGSNDVFVSRLRLPSLTSIFVDPSNPTIVVGENQQFLASGGFSDGSFHVLPPAAVQAGGLTLARANAQATRLRDGRVLLTGGEDAAGLGTDSAELYGPDSDAWFPTDDMVAPRLGHTSTLLADGQVLVAGGASSAGCASDPSTETYDPASGTWSLAGASSVARHAATATLLPDGKVLVAGGGDRCGGAYSSAELYDPAARTWSATGSMATAREHHAAVLLGGGKVLVMGGDAGGPSFTPLASAEVYDPATGNWTPAGSMNVARMTSCSDFVQPFAALLVDGRVLAAGAVTGGGPCGGAPTATAETYDPAAGVWTLTGSLSAPRAMHTVTLLPTGEVLAAGGTSPGLTGPEPTELFDPSSGNWSPAGSLATGRGGHTATVLRSLDVLIAGGSDASGVLGSAERSDPEGVTWSSDDMAVASVDADGLASTLALGETTIAARSRGVTGTTALTVVPPNEPPSAVGQSVSTAEDTAKQIALEGTDPEGDPLTFTVVTPPAQGTLGFVFPASCTAGTCIASVSYTPGPDFNGSDAFTFQVHDGEDPSAAATVSITVTPVNDAPVATAQSVVTAEDMSVAITLSGSDPDGDPVTFLSLTSPQNGTLSGAAPDVIYTPGPGFNGADSFSFKVHDGAMISAAATVSITITPVNDPPVADAGQDDVSAVGTRASLDGGRSRDPDGTTLSYTWEQVDGPATVTLTDPFRPSSIRFFDATVLGSYTFQLTVSDGLLSASDEVVITIVEAILPATLEPTQGRPGTAFTITDPHGRMRQGDLVRFALAGFSQLRLAENVVISSDGTTLSGTVPELTSGAQYLVTVAPSLQGMARFALPRFFVPFGPGEPSIATPGFPGAPFIITDGQGRMAGAQTVVFVEPGFSPEEGTRVDRIFVSADGTELIGEVPTNLLTTGYVVCVLDLFDRPVFNCLPFQVTGDSTVTISPVVGPPGTTLFISDPEKRLRPGDRVIFYRPGTDPLTEGALAGHVSVGLEGRLLSATVPLGLATNLKYFVSVRPSSSDSPRFDDLFFAVVEPRDPLIVPMLGPIGTRFTVIDPDRRMRPGDHVIFRHLWRPVPDVPAEDVGVSDDGKTLTGRVPQGLVEGTGTFTESYRVSVRPAPSEPPRFAELHFGVTEAPADALPPAIAAPADVTVEGNTVGGAAGVSLGLPVVSDEVDPAPVVTNDAPSFFPLGTTTVTWTATDASGNSASAAQAITVVDTTPPLLQGVPADQAVEATSTAGAPVDYSSPTATDVVDPAPAVGCQPASGSTFPLGPTLVTCSATDASTNYAEASFRVTVEDTTPPQLVVPADRTVMATGPQTPVDIGTASASDIFPVTLANDAPAGYPIGMTVVTWTATDASDNTASGTQRITVVHEFGGFLPPLREGGVYQLGRVIPVKFALFYADGSPVTTATATLSAQLLMNQEPSGDPIEVSSAGAANSGNLFRFTGDAYTFNLDTGGLAKGLYRLLVDLHDGSAPRHIDIGLK